MIPSPTAVRRDDASATGAVALRVEHLSLHYGSRRAVDDVSFDVAPGSIFCLLGSSGSGKSSALRLIAGLERATGGRITIDGRRVTDADLHVAPERRQVGMVFQDFALFPHLTVRANVAFGMRATPREQMDHRATALLDAVGLSDRGDSYPHMLSGGERQRVALARALAPKPAVLLMDEPFSSLDARLRDHIRDQTLDVLRRTGTTTVLVTHDAVEAMRVADRVGVLAKGRLVQIGTASELYDRPCSPEMAAFLGTVNTLPATIDHGQLRCPLGVSPRPAPTASGPVVVCVRPHHLELHATAGRGVPARVATVTCVGDATELSLELGQTRLIATVARDRSFAVGEETFISADPSHLLIFPTPDHAGAGGLT